MSPALAKYFHAKEGVLVASAPTTGAWNALQDGDVIEAIDGRTPMSGPHATRILRSYQKGEKIGLRVLRERKSLELKIDAPATDDLVPPGSRQLNWPSDRGGANSTNVPAVPADPKR